MNEKNYEAIIEAILFTMGESVELDKIAAAIELDKKETKAIIEKMMKHYENPSIGVKIIELDDAYQMCTKSEMYEYLIKIARQPKRHVLTDVLLETLSIIAYRQPVTKMEIGKIRGVNSDGVIASLVDKGLVRELGRDPQRGQAIIYGTTNAFLEKFGLRSTRDLPDLEQFAPDEQSRQFIRERLSGRSIQSTLEEQAEDLDEERELLDTDVVDVEAVENLETLVVDETSEDLHDED